MFMCSLMTVSIGAILEGHVTLVAWIRSLVAMDTEVTL